MGDPPRSPTTDISSILGISKDIYKAYKSILMRWNPDKNPLNKSIEAEAISETNKVKNEEERSRSKDDATTVSVGDEESLFTRRTASRRSKMPTPSSSGSSNSKPSSFTNSSSSRNRRCSTPVSKSMSSTEIPTFLSINTSSMETEKPAASASLSTNTSSRRSNNPIIFSQSKKPSPVEKKLECTLEELSKGCVKKIKITRDVITNIGTMVQEEEIVMIKVKPGWKKGTKITFEEGKGDDKPPGYLPADIILVIDEKRHPFFERDGDDLEILVEIPLAKALTGCSLPVPLLGGDKMTLSFDDIIFPGYQKVIRGQGMPNPKQPGRRGDLRIKFLVQFPTKLSNEKRFEAFRILQDCS